MKIVISPAKNFKKIENINTTDLIFKKDTEKLVEIFRKKSLSEIGNIFKINQSLTEKVYYDYQEFDINNLNSPAIFTYDGLVYKQFSPKDFHDLSYLNEKVYIFSALYGILKPLTGIRPYRLDMMIKDIDMYDFWKDKVKKEVFKDEKLILNLASKEYIKLIKPYLDEDERIINIEFKDYKNSKLRTVVSWTKQMRGAMLKYLIINKIEDPEEIKKIKLNGYEYDSLLSKKDEWIFVRREI